MRRLVLIAAACAACGGGEDAPDAGGDADAAPWVQNGACAQNTRIGEIHVDHVYQSTNGAFVAEIREGLDPADIMTPREADGPCQLFRRERYTCPLPCPGDQTCDGTMCIPRKRTQSAGTITVDGLMVPLTAEPNAVNKIYFDTTLPNPPFAPGDRITLTAAGDEVPGFTLRATGVAPLVIPTEDWTILRDQPFTVTWDTAGSEDSTMLLTVNIDQHGNTPVLMFCDVPDTGSYTISAGLLTTWIAYGITGAPSITFTRHSSDSLQRAEGCIEFAARSAFLKVIHVEGHTPCMMDMDCPPPLTCDELIETCVAP